MFFASALLHCPPPTHAGCQNVVAQGREHWITRGACVDGIWSHTVFVAASFVTAGLWTSSLTPATCVLFLFLLLSFDTSGPRTAVHRSTTSAGFVFWTSCHVHGFSQNAWDASAKVCHRLTATGHAVPRLLQVAGTRQVPFHNHVFIYWFTVKRPYR